LVEEVQIIFTGLMWTSLQGIFNLGTGPWRSGKLDWSATVLIMAEQALRRVLYIVERSKMPRPQRLATSSFQPPRRNNSTSLAMYSPSYAGSCVEGRGIGEGLLAAELGLRGAFRFFVTGDGAVGEDRGGCIGCCDDVEGGDRVRLAV
jgi:hypothetical protein